MEGSALNFMGLIYEVFFLLHNVRIVSVDVKNAISAANRPMPVGSPVLTGAFDFFGWLFLCLEDFLTFFFEFFSLNLSKCHKEYSLFYKWEMNLPDGQYH